MAEIEKIITITTEIGDTQTKLEAIERQLAILIKENEELAAANKQTTRSYENNSKAIQELTTDIQVKNQRLGELKTKLDSTKSSTDKLTTATQSNRKSVLENGGAMGLLGAATGGLSNDFKDAVEAIQLTGVSLKGLRGALIATGIGALAIVLLELVTNWDKWSGVIDGSTKATKKLNDELEINKILLQDITYLQDTEIAIMKAKGVEESKIWEQEKQNLSDKQSILADQIIKQKSLLEEATKSYKFWSNVTNGIISNKDKINEAEVELKKLNDEMTKLNDEFTIKSITRETSFREENKKTTTNIKEEVVKRKEALGQEIESLDLLALARAKAAGIVKRLELPKEESPIEKLKREYEEEKKILEAANESTLQLTAAFNLNMLALKQESIKKRKDADDEAAKIKAQEDEQRQREQVEIFAGTLDDFAEALGEGTKEQLAIAEAAFQIRKIMADGEVSLIEGVQATLAIGAKALGEHTALGKAAGVANATIKTYESATNAFNSLSGIPIVGPALGAAAAGVAVAAGIANVKKILAVKVPGGGGGSAGGSGVPASVPQFNIVRQSSTNQLAQSINKQQTQPVKAYVVSSEISNQQALDRNRIQNSTFLAWIPFILMIILI